MDFVLNIFEVLLFKLRISCLGEEVGRKALHFYFLLLHLHREMEVVMDLDIGCSLHGDLGFNWKEAFIDRICEVDRQLGFQWNITKVLIKLDGKDIIDLCADLNIILLNKGIRIAIYHIIEVFNFHLKVLVHYYFAVLFEGGLQKRIKG